MKLPNQVSESIKQLNPEVFGSPLDRLHAEVLQRDKRATLVDHEYGEKPGTARRRTRIQSRGGKPALRVTLIALTHRAMDGDNLAAATKAVRDRIAQEFGLDDSERCIDWQYASVPTRGNTGTAVKIETV